MKQMAPMELLRTWNKLVRLTDEAEMTCLELLAHPDATPEQIMEVRTKLIKQRQSMTEGWKQINHYLVKEQRLSMYAAGALKEPAFITHRIEANKRRYERERLAAEEARAVQPVDSMDEIAAYGKER